MVQSRLSVRDSVVGYWWRPDACAAGPATQTAPRRWYRRTERSVGPTVSLQWAKQALFSSLTLPPFTYTCTRVQDIRHTDTHTYNGNVYTHIHRKRERERNIYIDTCAHIFSHSHFADILRESPSTERHERESEFLARPSRLQCVSKHPRDNLELLARTHACTRCWRDTRTNETFPRILVVLKSRRIGCWTARHATVSLISTRMP